MPESRNGAVIDTHERPNPGLWAVLSVQHLCAMFGATILVPILTGLSPAVALVTSGLGTLLYIAITGGRIPAYLGSSFAFIAPIISGAQVAGIPGAMFGAFCAGLVYLVVALLIRAFGVWADAVPFAVILMNIVTPLIDRPPSRKRQVVPS